MASRTLDTMEESARRAPRRRLRAKRQRSERRGRRGEDLAALWLQLKGYQILARRARTPAGEIDIVARRGATVVIVEVKARPDRGGGLIAVSPSAQRRLTRAASAWLAARAGRGGGAAPWAPLRFDVMVITPHTLPHHVRDAWRPEPEA